jgi:hypothetical protein
MTVNDVLNITLALADEIEDDGTISDVNVASYRVRTPGIINLLQAELIKEGDLFSTYSYSHKPVDNILSTGFNSFAIAGGDDITFNGTHPASAYHFEVDGECTVVIQDFTSGWNTLLTIVVPSTVTSFTAYKGPLTKTIGATESRITFSGSYRALAKNIALFQESFKPLYEPKYRPFFKVDMPSDFKSVDQIINEEFDSYSKNTDYRWEGRKDLYVPWGFDGNIRVTYRPIPAMVTVLTATVQLDDITARTVLAYGLGMELFKEENEDIYNHFRRRYAETISKATKKQPISAEQIVDVYGGFN